MLLSMLLIAAITFYLIRAERLQAINEQSNENPVAALTDEEQSSRGQTPGQLLPNNESVALPSRQAIRNLRAVSYNIRHGEGSDSKLDLARTGDVLKSFDADFIGLQEVDSVNKRTGEVDQVATLGKQLDMQGAFGAFMDFQGGQYGMAILSKHPITNVQPLRLPEGNEPRIALIVDVQLPGDETISIVNVHFDWVEDDRFRFEQAKTLAEFLKELDRPYILLGDFNDLPGSRTLELFQEIAKEAEKPAADRFTFSATEPHKEIDFIFVAPAERWSVKSVRVVDERVASDHRPVISDLLFTPEGYEQQ